MLFLLLVPVLRLFQSKPPWPPASLLSVLKSGLSFSWGHRPCLSLSSARYPPAFPHLLAVFCLHASVLLFPCPKVCLCSTSPMPLLPLKRGEWWRRASGHHLGPLPLSVPLTTLHSLFLAFPRSWGLPGPHRGVLSCSCRPRPFCCRPQRLLGYSGPRPGSASPQLHNQPPPTLGQSAGAEFHLSRRSLRGKVFPLDSRPSSPALYFASDVSLAHKSPDPFGAVAAQKFSLAHSMLAISGHLDSDDDSGSGSLVGIDNKIEQAMDLVKSHLMFAVREEVEVLKEQIRDLAERNAALEQENGLLRALASPEQLAQLPSSGVPRLGHPAPNGPSI
ncbi:TSC22 domain family protein 4 isoform X2 [Sapajus apella]|uniref:TSC22 domain family protein 4 isoform X2 n=1 Tax=Sapajus apella TaxID=9515 RepID=A0A6J3G0U6_SAPAP|nr:TSC22 domain family protein 4 isoform X2 [Sapajus apella]